MTIKAISLVNKQFSDIIVVKSRAEAFEKAKSILHKNNISWEPPANPDLLIK